MGVILINLFEVPAGREDEFAKLWDAAADYMGHQPGFRWTRLHQAVTPNPRYAFVNIAEMDSPEQFIAAISTDEFAALTAPMKDFPAAPTLYRVVREISE
jgi:heme oxygenase (mycobilin-producing)